MNKTRGGWLGRGKSLADRLWSQTVKTDTCWLFQGAKLHFGHGLIMANGKRGVRAHRVAWELTHGPIPEGVQVNHRCDVPSCVNPEHLYLGSQKDNVRDALSRKRRPQNQKGRWNGYYPRPSVNVEA